MTDRLNIDYGLEQALNMGPQYPNKVFLADPIPLTSKTRRALPDTEFAYVAFGPKGGKTRKYPLNNASHAKNAMARLNGQYNKGKLTDAKYNRIRSRILKSYKKFGIVESKPSAIVQIKQKESILPMAAEPKVDRFSAQCMENKMVTKAQRREIALKNLRKAWKAKGMSSTFEPTGEPKPRRKSTKAKTGSKLTKAQRAAISRRNIKKAQAARRRMAEPKPRKKAVKRTTKRMASPAFVYEPAPRKPVAKKPAAKKRAVPSKAGTGASRARTLSKSEFERQESRRLKEIKTKSEASKKIATAKKRAASRGRPKASTRGKWERAIPVGTYKGSKDGNVIQIRRVYSKRNPDWSKPAIIASAAGGVILGVAVSDLADRFIATMAPQGVDSPLYGTDAMAAVRTKTNAWRLATSFTGTAIGLGGAYALGRGDSESTGRDVGMVMLGGFGVAFGVKFLTQVVTDVIMPVIFKVDTRDEQSISNRLYADKQDYSGLSSQNDPNTSNGNGSGTNAGVMGTGRPNIYHLPSVRSSFGPVATKNIGTAGCGGDGPAHSFLANIARRQVGASGCGNKSSNCGSGDCADGPCNDPNIPSYMQKRGGGQDKPPANGGKPPVDSGYKTPPPPPVDSGYKTPTPKPYTPMAKTPSRFIATREDLLRYTLNMPGSPAGNIMNPSGGTYTVPGLTGVGTAGVYGHLFKKAV